MAELEAEEGIPPSQGTGSADEEQERITVMGLMRRHIFSFPSAGAEEWLAKFEGGQVRCLDRPG
jgi:hypothetical protein